MKQTFPQPEQRRRWLIAAFSAVTVALGLGAGAAFKSLRARRGLPEPTRTAPVAPALAPPDAGMAVFHLGHSLVGRDMPVMLEQLTQAAGLVGHNHHSQLGWGTSLREHWEPDQPINGFAVENDHPRFRPAREALAEGAHDAVVLTEMVELRDAIRWHDSPTYFPRWVAAAREGRADVRIYLYTTWHNLEHPEGWLARLEGDPQALWEPYLLAPAWADPAAGAVHVIPVTEVLAELTRRLAAGVTAAGLETPRDLFATAPDGSLDTIHLNPQGLYLVALTHFAVLYQRDPAGLPHELQRVDAGPGAPPTPGAAALMQRVVWDVVSRHPLTGIALGEDE